MVYGPNSHVMGSSMIIAGRVRFEAEDYNLAVINWFDIVIIDSCIRIMISTRASVDCNIGECI